MSRWTCKWFFLSVILLALVVGGCGGNGNGGGMAGGGTPDPEPEPMCPAGQTGTYPNCMTPPPPAPAGGHTAVIDGIVNPTKAGDPSTKQGTAAPNRPGNAAANAEAFNVEPGNLGTPPKTTIGAGANTATALFLDELDKDDMTPGASPKSLEGQFMNQNMDSMLGGFAGSVHEKMTGEGDDKVVDTINVFTNMDAAKSATYADYYDGNADRDGVSGVTGNVLTLESTDKLDLFSGPSNRIPTQPNQQYAVPLDNGSTTTVEENKFMGMFNGIPGTYACTGSVCTLATDKDGDLTISGGTLTFTPTETNPMRIMLPGVSYDDDYLSFGYWVRTTGEGDDTKYGVGTFFDGSEAFTAPISSIEGNATYSGKAAGMYGRKTLNQYGQVVSGSETSGHFTADANLTARFGGNDIAANKQNQIEGTVTNFMDGDEMISPNWELTLDTIRNIDSASRPLTGTTTGDGNWVVEFFGNPASTTPAEESYPNAVAGEFTGHFANGHVIGAFGATKDKE